MKFDQKGFTLIEMLAVTIVFVSIGAFVTTIIFNTLRGNNKTNAIATVQDNGTYATTQMSKLIRNARSLDSSTSCGTISTPVSGSTVAVVAADGQKVTFSCYDNNGNGYLASNSAPLVDHNTVAVSNCSFSCGRNSLTDFPVITINFSLSLILSNSTFVDKTASASAIPFQTSVVMRNMER